MQNEQTILERRKALLGTGPRLYYQFPFHPVRAQGVYMYEADGTRYLDAYNNVPHVGHCHPRVVEAIARQAATLNTNTRYLFDSVLDYAQRLVDTCSPGLDTVLFTCTGSESNDLVARMAKVVTGNTGMITTHGAYHGNTIFLRAMDGTVVDKPENRATWWDTISYPDDSVSDDPAENERKAQDYATQMAQSVQRLSARGHAPAAFFFDTHFAADGIHIPPSGFMEKAVSEVRKAGGLIVADEVQPGLGRNGSHFWGYQCLGITPDFVTCGKPMGNGVGRRAIRTPFPG